MNTKRKALTGALAATAVGAAVLTTGASSAYFFDAEAVDGHRIEAGTLDLDYSITGTAAPAGKIAVKDIKPGDSKTFTVKVTNVGTVKGFVSAKIADVVNAENGVQEPEKAAFDLTSRTGELGLAMRINAGDKPQFYGSTSLLTAQVAVNHLLGRVALEPGEASEATFTVWLPDTGRGDTFLGDNIVMSDSYEFDLDLSLSQK